MFAPARPPLEIPHPYRNSQRLAFVVVTDTAWPTKLSFVCMCFFFGVVTVVEQVRAGKVGCESHEGLRGDAVQRHRAQRPHAFEPYHGSIVGIPHGYVQVRPESYVATGRGGGAYSFAACLSHLTIDHASLSRRSTVPTPN